MYRKYLTISLPTQTLNKKNQYAPDGIKFCNGLCQDFTTTKMICLSTWISPQCAQNTTV